MIATAPDLIDHVGAAAKFAVPTIGAACNEPQTAQHVKIAAIKIKRGCARSASLSHLVILRRMSRINNE